VNAAIEIRKNLDGRIQARRFDGKPLTSEDREEARRMAVIEELPPRAWVAQEARDGSNLKAIKICSAVLQDHLWLIFDRSFEPKDGLAIYYPEELAVIATKSQEELKEIHKVKLKFPGCRVIQEGAEDTPLREARHGQIVINLGGKIEEKNIVV
jgi:hypothetical protein